MNKLKKLPKNLANHKSANSDPNLNLSVSALDEYQSIDFVEIIEEVDSITPFESSAEFSNLEKDTIQQDDLISEKVLDVLDIEHHVEEHVHTSDSINVKKSFWNRNKVENASIIKENLKPEVQKEENVVTVKESSKQDIRKEEKEMSINKMNDEIKESAVISSTMVVKGDVELDTSLILNGKVFGNIKCNDLIEATFGSYIEGNIEAKSIKFNGSELKGNISVDDYFEANYQTKVLGNIQAKRVEISGHVHGEINASEGLVLKNTAVVQGDLYSASISIEAGAQIEGKVVTIAKTTKLPSTVEETEEE